MIPVLVDFDNFFGPDTAKLTSELLEFEFSEMVNLCEKKFYEIDFIQIRLYGGWHYETALTKQASTLQQLLSDVKVFPKINKDKIIRGSIELISSLHELPDYVWYFSHKETDGIRRIRINFDEIDQICHDNREQCPKFILNKFTKSKLSKCPVNNCNNFQRDVFKGIVQKMVDTLISCDILSLSEDCNITGVVLISDDQDFLPSLALAKKRLELNRNPNFQDLVLVIRNGNKYDFISSFLSPFNIPIHTMP